jgi:hypothetical protein
MLDQLQKRIFHFMKTHERLDKYNAIWLCVPANHDLTPKIKWYEEVAQWNGKEMKEMSRYLLGVVTQSLRGGSPAQRPIFNLPIQCPRALLEFYMYGWYKSHDDATLSYMEDALCRVHTITGGFLLGQAGKKAKVKPKALISELVKKRKLDEETNTETWTPSKQQRQMNALQDYISHEIGVSKQLDADFNIPEIHMMSHWVEQIRRDGALQQYSAETHEQAHIPNLQDSGNTSNHNLNYLPQVITFQRRILCFKIRELNLPALTPRREKSTATCKVLPSGTDLVAHLSSQLYAKPEFMGPQNRHDGMHPDTMIQESRALLNNTQDAKHRLTIYNCMWGFLKHKSRNKTYISDEQLHALELCNYHCIKVQVDGLDGECISQMCRGAGSQSWCGGDRRNDWVWVMQRPGRWYIALNGHLPWQLQGLFKIKLRNGDGAFVEYWLALSLTTVPENTGNFNLVWKFVPVRNAPTVVALQVFRVGNIVRCAHIIPDITAGSKTGDGRNGWWIVHTHIDLTTSNDEYN